MSHVETVTTKITALDALLAAASDLQGIMRPAQTYRWYGRHVGDYPLPKGITVDDLGKCDFKITFPGINYEVGVKLLPEGHYTLLYDFYGNGGQHDGQLLLQRCGAGMGTLLDHYQHHCIRLAAPKSQKVHKVASEADAVRLSRKLGQRITYAGKLRTICVAA